MIFGTFLLLTQYLQLIRGYAPVAVAVALALTPLTPLILPIVLVSLGAPQLAARFGLRTMLVAGLTALSAGALPAAVRGAFEESLAAGMQTRADGVLPGAQSAFVHGCTSAALVLAVISVVSAAVVAVWAPGRVAVPALATARAVTE